VRPEEAVLAFTVQDAIAAVASKQGTLPADQAAYIQASVSITDAGTGTITGKGPLYRTTILGNLFWVWDSGYKFLMERAGSGPSGRFLLGLDIEPLITLVGPVAVQPPAFITPLLQRHSFLLRRRYQGVFGLYLQPQFGVVLTEDQANPRLTGAITSSALTPGPIVPPGTIEVVLESVQVADVFQ